MPGGRSETTACPEAATGRKKMCQRLYLASRSELPTVERGPGSPYLRVRPLTAAASGVRRWFSRDAKHFAEAYGSSPSDCGCGFPEVSDGRNDRPVDREDAEAVSALATHLERRPRRAALSLARLHRRRRHPALRPRLDHDTARAGDVHVQRAVSRNIPGFMPTSADWRPGAQAKDLTTPKPKSGRTQACHVGLSRL